MIMVGAFQAKTHLFSLLDRVAAGEEVVMAGRSPGSWGHRLWIGHG
jgi:antitoxin (DNA-binding transcriptional repressor) of toxin-antitoxin stability system